MEQKHHWKQFINLDYIGAYSLDGKDLTVKIVSVAQEQVTGTGGKKELCMVAKLEGQKPLILNRTNAKTITKLYNSPFVEDWAGKHITLFATTTQVGGETVECLRIRSTIPQVKKADTPRLTEKLRACTSLEQLKKVYDSLQDFERVDMLNIKDEMKAKLSAPAASTPNTTAK